MIGEGDRVRLSQRGLDTLNERDDLVGNLLSEGVVVDDRFMGQVGVVFHNLRWEHADIQDEDVIFLWRDDLELDEPEPIVLESDLDRYEAMNDKEVLAHIEALQDIARERKLV